jgi:hypothetical protein
MNPLPRGVSAYAREAAQATHAAGRAAGGQAETLERVTLQGVADIVAVDRSGLVRRVDRLLLIAAAMAKGTSMLCWEMGGAR